MALHVHVKIVIYKPLMMRGPWLSIYSYSHTIGLMFGLFTDLVHRQALRGDHGPFPVEALSKLRGFPILASSCRKPQLPEGDSSQTGRRSNHLPGASVGNL